MNIPYDAEHYRESCFQTANTDPLREGLELLCHRLGRQVTAAELGDGLPLDAGRLPLEYVPRALRRASINAKVAALDLDELTGRLLPALLVTEDHSTLLLVSWSDNQAQLFAAGGWRW